MGASEFKSLYEAAYAAGKEAAAKVVPPAMVVYSADLAGNRIPGSKSYYVPDGPCGFAWVKVRPGNSAFARWLVRSGLARKDSYNGGVSISISAYNQSVARKEAHAYAMAEALREAGFRAYADSRLD